jgi:radical SAM protein with 4Fe4S-binding SPASM domain
VAPGNLEASTLLETTWHLSRRMWHDRLGEAVVVFAPDRKGLPVVISSPTFALLEQFTGGLRGATAVSNPPAVDESGPQFDALAVLRFLVDRGFLRPEPDADRYQAKDLLEYQPRSLSIWLHINNHCNLDCAYCFVDKTPVEMSDEVIDSTVGYLAETVHARHIKTFALKFAGGEPTLSVGRMELFRNKLTAALSGSPCDWSVSVLSNGTVMSDRLISFLQQPRTGISISVDGYGPAGHDIFRVFRGTDRGSWRIIERNIQKARKHGITPYIMATISQESSHTLPDLVRWIFGQGLRARLGVVRQPSSAQAYSSFRDTAPQRDLASGYAALTTTLIGAFEAAFEELERPEYEIDLRNALHICELHFDSPSFTSCCGIGLNHLVINERGELASCPMTVHRDNVQPSTDLVAGTRATFADYSPIDREDNEGKNCLDCKWFPVCVSGCPVNNLSVNGRPYTVSPLNPFYEYVIPRYVRFSGVKLLQAAARRGIERFHVLSA